jgi:hypothetical protein
MLVRVIGLRLAHHHRCENAAGDTAKIRQLRMLHPKLLGIPGLMLKPTFAHMIGLPDQNPTIYVQHSYAANYIRKSVRAFAVNPVTADARALELIQMTFANRIICHGDTRIVGTSD